MTVSGVNKGVRIQEIGSGEILHGILLVSGVSKEVARSKCMDFHKTEGYYPLYYL